MPSSPTTNNFLRHQSSSAAIDEKESSSFSDLSSSDSDYDDDNENYFDAEEQQQQQHDLMLDYYYDGAGGIVASGADTTLTYKLSLANDYSATLQIDTMIGIFSGFHPEYTWLGIWSKNNDTLYIEFTQFSTLYPFTFNGEKPKPELEELPNSIIKKFIIGLDYQGKEIYSLTEIREDDDLIVYR